MSAFSAARRSQDCLPRKKARSTSPLPPSHPQVRLWQKLRRLAKLCCLLERIGQPDQRRLAPGAAEKRDADGKSENVSGGHCDVRIAGDGGGAGASARIVIAIHQVRGKGRRCGGS